MTSAPSPNARQTTSSDAPRSRIHSRVAARAGGGRKQDCPLAHQLDRRPPPAVIALLVPRGKDLRPHGSPAGKDEADPNSAWQSLASQSDRFIGLIFTQPSRNVSGRLVLDVLCQPGVRVRLRREEDRREIPAVRLAPPEARRRPDRPDQLALEVVQDQAPVRRGVVVLGQPFAPSSSIAGSFPLKLSSRTIQRPIRARVIPTYSAGRSSSCSFIPISASRTKRLSRPLKSAIVAKPKRERGRTL